MYMERHQRLIRSIQINNDIDRCDNNLGENEDDDDPLEEFALRAVSHIFFSWSVYNLRG